jgi:hypothetical protein
MLEGLTERPSFAATEDQLDWMERARIKAHEPSIAEWMRGLIKAAGKELLGEPFPERKPVSAPPRKKPR